MRPRLRAALGSATAVALILQAGGLVGAQEQLAPVILDQFGGQLDGQSGLPTTSTLPSRAAQQAQQAPPPPLTPLTISQLDDRLLVSDLSSDRPISISFAAPVPIRDLLLLLVRDTNLSMVPDTDVDGTFSGELKNVTLRQALETILQPLDLNYTVQENIVRVFRTRMETRIFDINYVITQRSGSRGISATTTAGAGTSGLGGSGAGGAAGGAVGGGNSVNGAGSSASVSGSDTSDLFSEIQNGLQTLLSPDARFNLDRKAGILQVTDFPEQLDRVGEYLEAVQLRVNRQVQIEARVIEVELRDQYTAGINWGLLLDSAGDAVTLTQTLSPATSGGFTMGLDIRDFDGLLNAFATQGEVNVLSSPRVLAMNNEPAVMRVGTQDVFFITETQVDAGTGQLLQSVVTPTSITEGVVLSVTPQIASDGVIHMSVSPSITERQGVAVSRLGDSVPIISVRETDTLVRVHPGETAVIAGLMAERVTQDTAKVPILGDMPFVGGLFRREERNRRKTDLIILLTPTIMTPAAIIDDAGRERERLYQAQQALRGATPER